MLLLSTILLRRQRTNRPQSRLHARRQLVLRLVARRRSHVIWEHPRSRHWWDTIVPDFNAQQFMQNFRVSRDSFMYICDRTKTILARQDTNYRLSSHLWDVLSGGQLLGQNKVNISGCDVGH
ncbi:protein ANTAGONIST OF LIKE HETEROCHROMATIN PROTEIN 1-like [Scomber scombrus]|uniref:Protein ANTAGONIST OF LIKE HETEROCHROMATIN PROTEIN 1-like n=1 Tax=Scomber scombrus TaxID=13677 RepID=A0AAV1PL30_SCOSC